MTRTRFTRALLLALTLGFIGGVAQPASAQVFLSPIVGYNFGGDSGCPSATNCENKNLNIGVAFGNYGRLFGIEEEFAYAKDFFGDAPSYDASVVTLMTNLLLSPDTGRVRPYGLVGIGLIKSHVEFATFSALNTESSKISWNAGGGIVGQFSNHFGARVDVRFFKAMKDLEILGVGAQGSKLKFGRLGAGLVVFF